MRIIEGSPEEIAELHKLTGILDRGEVEEAADEQQEGPTQPGSEGKLSRQVREWIAARAGGSPERRSLVEEFVSRVVALGGVEVELGSSEKTPDGSSRYLMLRNSGPRHFGAAMYLHPNNGKVNFHLPADRAEGRRFARPSQRRSAYRVTTYLTKLEVVEEAVELAKEALDHTR